MAIWQLAKYQRLLPFLLADSNSLDVKETGIQVLALNDVSEIDYVGLNEHDKSVVTILIKVSANVLKAAIGDQNQLPTALEDYVLTIREYLEQPGLTSWLACRCAANLLLSIFLQRSSYISSILEHPSWKPFWNAFKVFYPKGYWAASANEDDDISHFVRYAIHPYFLSDATPSYVRLKAGGELIDVTDLLADDICRGSELPFSWIKSIPLTRSMIRSLIEKCEGYLPILLASLCEKPIIHYDTRLSLPVSDEEIYLPYARTSLSSPLPITDIRRILKIVRNSNDPKILSGGLIALSSSKFLRSAGVDLTLKLIRADQSKAEFAKTLFDRRYVENLDATSRGILNEIASSILESPNEYAFWVTCAAAEYLAEHSQIGLPSLLTMEDELNLHICSK